MGVEGEKPWDQYYRDQESPKYEENPDTGDLEGNARAARDEKLLEEAAKLEEQKTGWDRAYEARRHENAENNREKAA